MTKMKLYDNERDVIEMDRAGGYYCRHVSAMTGEALHSKSDIAAELGWRDMQIDQLKADNGAYKKLHDWLKVENERLSMQLVGCGVVSLANTPDSARQARNMHPDYMSAACSDVARAVDREMALRTKLDEARELLSEPEGDTSPEWADEWRNKRDAWLASR